MTLETPSYEIEPRNPFFQANRSIVEYEIRPGRTVCFLSEVDLTEVERLRAKAVEQGTRKPSYTAFVAKAVALALRQHPFANRRVCRRAWLPFARPRLQRFHRFDVAIACERDVPGAEGVAFVDVLRDADRLSLTAMTDWLHALATCDIHTNEQWRGFSTLIRKLPHGLATLLIRLPYFFPSLWVKYRGGAVLISSPAKYGIEAVLGTWSWPLGVSFGLVKKRPVVRGDQVVPCPTFLLTLNFDRRIMAGAPAARFFKHLVDMLEHAETEMAPYLPEAVATAAPVEVQSA
jgi:pyruvate/2-oxoglutarate dehydrogenase complex dihydrolipoamide acyltransferase (E2) component